MAGPARSERIEFLDFAKGFAILGIVLYHYLYSSTSGLVQRGTQLGGAGVHLFLMLAGFGLALSPRPTSWAEFYRRRFTRILVPYYLVITALFLLNLVRPYFPGDGLYAYLGHIFLFKMFDERIFMSYGSVFWFISVLVAMYLVYPLLLSVQERLGNVRFVVVAGLVSVAYLAVVLSLGLTEVRVVSDFFLSYLWEFCVGMALGRAYRERGYEFWAQPIPVLAAVAFVGLATMALAAVVGGNVGRVLNDVPALIGYTALAALAYALAKRYGDAAVLLLVFLGAISFELYLTHIVVWRAVTQDVVPGLSGTSLVIESLLVVPLAVLVAYALRWMTRRIGPKRTGKATG